MIITLKKNASKEEAQKIINQIEQKGLHVTVIEGANYNVYGVVGDTTVLDEKVIAANPAVDNVQRVAAPYKKANRMFHPAGTLLFHLRGGNEFRLRQGVCRGKPLVRRGAPTGQKEEV